MNFSYLEDLLKKFGICDWGYTEEPSAESFSLFQRWAAQGRAKPLAYLTDHRLDKRKDLRHIYPAFQSALVFLFDYSLEKGEVQNFYGSSKSNKLKIASYALGFSGQDYHLELKRRLSEVGQCIQRDLPNLKFVHSLDVHPVLERDLAYRAGLGWFGKNSMLIHQKHGSFFIIGSLLLNKKLDLPIKPQQEDHCGHCRRCVDACPTKAIDPKTRTLKADKCISTFTIELFADHHLPPQGMDTSVGEIFGCDICQDVCPWNKPLATEEVYPFEKSEEGLLLYHFFLSRPIKTILASLRSMSKRGFRKLFGKTPLARTGRDGMIKNLSFRL